MKVKSKIFHIILLSAILLTTIGCATQKKCERKYPSRELDSSSVSFIHDTTIVYKDTLITIGSDTSYIEYFIICDTARNKPLDIIKTSKSGKAKATVELKDGKLKVECLCEEEKILITKLEEHIRVISKSDSNSIKVKVVREKYIPTIYKYSLYYSIISLILCILYILYKVRNAPFKLF